LKSEVEELKLATIMFSGVGDTKCMLGTWHVKKIKTRDFFRVLEILLF
jgi:hypothetical protein